MTDSPERRKLESKLHELGVAVLPTLHDNAAVLANPVEIYRCYLTDILTPIIPEVDPSIIYEAIQWTNSLTHGDLVVVIPRLRLKGSKPAHFAKDLCSKFPGHPLFKQPIASGIHFQISFAPDLLPQILLPFIFDRTSFYGCDKSCGYKNPKDPAAGRKKAIVEFSSPNIAKEFHAGHLRSTIIGAYISNLYKSMGWDVVNMNYLGDWGKQFGLVAVGWKRFGSEELLAADPLSHLLDVYVRINKLFKIEEAEVKTARDHKEDTSQLESQGLYKERNDFFSQLEAREPEALALWKRFRDISIRRYVTAYERLNITFDDYSGESQVDPKTIDKVQSILTENGVLKEDNNALIIDFKQYGAKNLEIAVVRNRQGTTTYLLRDIAAVLEREEKYNFDKMIYVISSEQDVYMKRLFKVIELMGYIDLAKKLEHVNFGKVEGMSSRLGKVELLGDILDRCGDAMHDVMRNNDAKYQQVQDPKRTSDTLGIAAVMVQDMSGKRVHNYPFDIKRMTEPIGDTGPYLEFSHARLSSIVRKSGFSRDSLEEADFSLLREPHVIDTLRLMAQYPDVTHNALKTLEPTTILTYLFKFNHQVSSGYEVIRAIDIPEGQEDVSTVHVQRVKRSDPGRRRGKLMIKGVGEDDV